MTISNGKLHQEKEGLNCYKGSLETGANWTVVACGKSDTHCYREFERGPLVCVCTIETVPVLQGFVSVLQGLCLGKKKISTLFYIVESVVGKGCGYWKYFKDYKPGRFIFRYQQIQFDNSRVAALYENTT